MASQKQLAANRLNAQKSTGPRSVEGKAHSSMNALKTGIDAASTTYFSDGEHPTAAGHAILGPIAKAAIQTVW